MRCRAAALFSMLLAGCAQQPVEQQVQCTEPRPQVCTMIYEPVCATRTSGEEADYSSGCNACADDSVTAYRDGACAAEDGSD